MDRPALRGADHAMKLLVAIALAGCAETPSPAPRTPPRTSIAPIDAAPSISAPIRTDDACIREETAAAVTLLEVDEPEIRACFGPTSCVAIDRRRGTIAPWSTTNATKPIARFDPVAPTVKPSDHAGYDNLCFGDRCILIASGIIDIHAMPISGDIAPGEMSAIVSLAGAEASEPLRIWLLHEFRDKPKALDVGIARCVEVRWAEPFALVTTDDCDGGGARGILFSDDGKRVSTVGGDGHFLDTRGARVVPHAHPWTLVAPRAYALVIFDNKGWHVVDLVAIQAAASANPQLEAMQLTNGDWLVASATGGIGIVDHTTLALAKTWIVPHCADANVSGP